MSAFYAASTPFLRLAPAAKATAEVSQAAALAADELLGGAFDERELVRIAAELKDLPICCSTYDLAAAVALNVLKSGSPPNRRDALARMTVHEWSREGKIVPALAQAFEEFTCRF
jgi:hypothetical protein